MPGLLTHVLKRAATAVLLAAAVLTVTAPPASAHSLLDAVRATAGCGWTSGAYTIQRSEPLLVGTTTTRYGTVYLLWSGTYGENCVVTLRTGAAHNVTGNTAAILYVGSLSNRYDDDADYAHYAAVAVSAAGRCVAFAGRAVLNGRTAFGSDYTFANCG